MNKIINTFLIAVMAAVLWSCHTTEANYKESYDKAVAASRTGERGVIYQQELEKRKTTNIVEDQNDIIKKYNVVVGEFQQKFNALSYRDRLRKEGHKSYVVYIGEKKLYCVVVEGYDDLSVAATFVQTPEKFMKIKVLVPRAWVLTRF